MNVVVGLRSGAVDLIYVVLFELLGVSLLVWIIEKITRQLANRCANERRRLKLIGSRWTKLLGRGSTRNGLILKAGFLAVSLASILMIDIGTNGLTDVGAISNEVVYIGKTSDVQSQQRFLGKVMKAVESNYSIGYYEMWRDLLQACRETSPQTRTVFRSFCGTSLCREVFREGQRILTDENDIEFTQENQNPDHSDKFRCNNGGNAPEIILSTHPRRGSIIGGPEVDVILDYSEDDWAELYVERNLVNRMFILQETLVEDPLNRWVLTCAQFENVYERRSCTVSYVPEEGNLIRMGYTISPQIHGDLRTGKQLDMKIDLNSFIYAEFLQVDKELLSTNHTEWMITLNVLALYLDVPSFEYIWHINSVLELGSNPVEIEENLRTEISAVAFVGAIILGSAIVIAAFGLLLLAQTGRRKAYLDLNLGLDDTELYGLMRNDLDDHYESEKREVRHVDIYIGFSNDQKRWGILSDGDRSIDGKIGLKELRRRQAANETVEEPI